MVRALLRSRPLSAIVRATFLITVSAPFASWAAPPGATLIRDAVTVDADGEVEVARELTGPDLESYCTTEPRGFDDCDFDGGRVRLETSLNNAPWLQKRGNLDSDYIFDARGYWAAFPTGVPRSRSAHTIHLSMPGNWVHRFGCLADPALPAEITFRGEGVRPPCDRMPPKRDDVYRYQGAFNYEYRERPRHMLISHQQNTTNMFVTIFVFIVMVALVLVARIVGMRRIVNAIWRN